MSTYVFSKLFTLIKHQKAPLFSMNLLGYKLRDLITTK